MSWALEVEGLSVRYGENYGVVDNSLRIAPGKVFGLIGETGSGKTSTALAVARLLPPSASVQGRITIDGTEVSGLTRRQFRALRGPKLGLVPQDALAALNPTKKIGPQLYEPFMVHDGASRAEAHRRAVEVLNRVWIDDPEAVVRLYPHQLSGGMRQRVMIAMAVALEPPLLIADEPTTALDVNTQAEVLKIIDKLRRDLGTAVLWITHDMGVVAELADMVGVMYAGRMVEQGRIDEVFDDPRHPYTAQMLRTLQSLRSGSSEERLYQIAGQPPRTATAVPGCAFHPRCPRRGQGCDTQVPAPQVADDRRVACHHPLLAEVVRR